MCGFMKNTKLRSKKSFFALMAVGCALALASADTLSASPALLNDQADQEAPATEAAKAATPHPAGKPSPGEQSPGTHNSSIGAPMHYAPKPISRRAELHYDL